MNEKIEKPVEVRVIGLNRHLVFEGREIHHEEEILSNLVGRTIFEAYRDAQSDVGITFLFDDSTWFSFGYSGDEGQMVAGKVEQV